MISSEHLRRLIQTRCLTTFQLGVIPTSAILSADAFVVAICAGLSVFHRLSPRHLTPISYSATSKTDSVADGQLPTMTRTFEECWDSLAAELRLEILGYALAFPGPIKAGLKDELIPYFSNKFADSGK